MLDFSIYLLYRVGTAIASLLPVRVLFAIGSFMGWWAWLLLPNYRRLARRNLEIAFAEEKSPRELRRIARRNFQNLSANLLCGVKMASIPPEKLARYVETENLDAMHRELRAGRPVIMLLSHVGNWELSAQLVPHYGNYARIGTVYQKLGNRYIDRDVSRKRASTGAELFDRARRVSQADRIAAFRRAHWDSRRSTCGRPWRLDAILRKARLDFPAAGSAGQKNRRSGHRRGGSYP